MLGGTDFVAVGFLRRFELLKDLITVQFQLVEQRKQLPYQQINLLTINLYFTYRKENIRGNFVRHFQEILEV
jgi:hypothetical protein